MPQNDLDLAGDSINDPAAMNQNRQKSVFPMPTPGSITPYFSGDNGRFCLYQGNCMNVLPLFPEESFDLVFADPPYFLSNGGITCHAGKMVSVNKGKWDRSRGFEGNYEFTRDWLAACQRVLKPNGSIWISGTSHIIHIVGCCLDELGYKILNDITWVKKNPPPNLSCRYFVHSTETLIWAGRDKKCRHKFNYQLMRRLNGGKQMKSVWEMDAPKRDEKIFGKHPTQKPLGLLERIIAASTDEDDVILDPFSGSATTGIAAAKVRRSYAGIELEQAYLGLGAKRFLGVPQADSPERLLDLLRYMANEDITQETLAESIQVTLRQVGYYTHAGFILGLLERESQTWGLTPLALRILSQPPNVACQMLAQQIICCPLVQAAMRKSRRARSGQAKHEIIAGLLMESTALGLSTCRRRASTLQAWIDWSIPQIKVSADNVFPASEKLENPSVSENLELLSDFSMNIPVCGVSAAQLAFKFIDIP